MTMPCWICGTIEPQPWKVRSIDRPLMPEDLQITDYRYGVTLALSRCRNCGFIFAVDGELQRLTQLYEELSDPGYLESLDSRALQMRWLIDRILAANPHSRTLLDVGAGAGLLVAEAQRRNLAALGVEPSRSLVETGRRVNGVELLQGTFPHPQLIARTFDVICLIDVIEHVTNPIQMLRDCAEALTPEGLLVVVTPDVGSITARLMGTGWWHYRLAHVGYFNNRTIRSAAATAGLSLRRTFRARWFFRLSYIAERLTRYVPIGRINSLAARHRVLRSMYDTVVRINPRDSMVVLLQRSERTQ